MPKRRSHLLKLPPEMLEHVNVMLDEGATYQAILDWLTEKGFHDYSIDTLFQWKNGGFLDWRAEQERIIQQQALLKWGLEGAKDTSPETLAQAMLHFAGTKLFSMIGLAEEASVKNVLQQRPEVLANYFNSMSWLIKEAVELLRISRSAKSGTGTDPLKPSTETGLSQAEKNLKLL